MIILLSDDRNKHVCKPVPRTQYICIIIAAGDVMRYSSGVQSLKSKGRTPGICLHIHICEGV